MKCYPATYSQPQIAAFGLTEQKAKERGFEVKIGRSHFKQMVNRSGWGVNWLGQDHH